LEGFTVLTFVGDPIPPGRKWRRFYVTLRHATPARNLASILLDGLLTSKSRGRFKAVWLHSPGRSHWAALHTVERHGGAIEEVVILDVQVPRAWLKRHGGSVEGLWRCVRDIPRRCIRRVITFGELSRSPALDTASR
jgi:hypothetical protein